MTWHEVSRKKGFCVKKDFCCLSTAEGRVCITVAVTPSLISVTIRSNHDFISTNKAIPLAWLSLFYLDDGC